MDKLTAGKGQEPEALFIARSDSRVDLNLITQTQPGDRFICRNAGNIVPAPRVPRDDPLRGIGCHRGADGDVAPGPGKPSRVRFGAASSSSMEGPPQ